jgi:hypothetical protein
LNPFTSSIKDSIPTVLVVGSTIIFFYDDLHGCHAFCLKAFFPDIHNNLMLLIAAMLEMTNGLKIGQELFSNQPTLLLVILATFLTSQSLSIHMQVAVIDKNRETVVKTITFS